MFIRFRFAVALFALCTPLFAHAALGDHISSVDADRVRLKASARMTQRAAYTLHELQSDNGVVVREFVSPAGTVFGVAWQGPALPDLQQVLGTHFDEYVQALRQKRARGPRAARYGNLIVQVSGHQRAITGRAYLADAIPANVNAEEVQ
jgi:Protein of unknown function (DUF2844)